MQAGRGGALMPPKPLLLGPRLPFLSIQFLWTLLSSADVIALSPCPAESTAKSVASSKKTQMKVRFKNRAGVPVNLLWVDFKGAEKKSRHISPDGNISQNSYPGHLFRFRVSGSDQLLLEYVVPEEQPTGSVPIRRCDGMNVSVSRDRWPEFEALVHDAAAPCLGHSSNWSCVRYVSPEEVRERDSASYGFHADELAGTPYKVGQTADHLYAWQEGYLINVTSYEGGYLKMEMTDCLKRTLYPWYEERLSDSLTRHRKIPGGFTNNERISMDVINLDSFREVRSAISQEMKEVLEWWTKMRLRHSATAGVRVYRRGSMLVNHLDRQETHVASAVLQVAQKVDEDGGWPLEVIHPHKSGRKEVYLQPGQMVLYEGARITHGRPMRFRGEEFGNIFVHFAPLTWHGLDRSHINPHFQQGEALQSQEL